MRDEGKFGYSKDENLKEWKPKETFERESKEIFVMCRVHVEGLSSEEISLLAGVKYFSEMREGEVIECSVAK